MMAYAYAVVDGVRVLWTTAYVRHQLWHVYAIDEVCRHSNASVRKLLKYYGFSI